MTDIKRKYMLILIFLISLFLLPACEREENPTENNSSAEISVEDDYIKYTEETIKKDTNVINNGKNFVKYDGCIYYREYSASSFEETGLWDDFNINPYGKSKINKLYPDGKIEEIWQGYGYGGLFIYEGNSDKPRLLLTRASGAEGQEEIYSIGLDGEILDQYGEGSIVEVDEQRDVAVVRGYGGSIEFLNLINGERKTVEETYSQPVYYDLEGGVLYYAFYIWLEEIKLYSAEYGESSKEIFTATLEDMMHLMDNDHPGDDFEFQSFMASGDHIWAYIAAYEGTGHFFNGKVLLKIKKDGSEYHKIYSDREVDWYGIDRPFSYSVDKQGAEALDGYYIYDIEYLTQPLEILTKDNLKSIGITTGTYFEEDDFISVKDIEYVDGDTFFTVVTGERNEMEDVGWKMAYNRVSIKVYMRKGETDEITLLYSY